jgi:hypothetical protein
VPEIIAERGLAAIGHHDLSPWCPGGSVLFIIGQDLDLEAVARLGFTVCARPQERMT